MLHIKHATEGMLLHPTDELLRINGKGVAIRDDDEFDDLDRILAFDDLKQTIQDAPRPIELTFLRGQRRDEAMAELVASNGMLAEDKSSVLKAEALESERLRYHINQVGMTSNADVKAARQLSRKSRDRVIRIRRHQHHCQAPKEVLAEARATDAFVTARRALITNAVVAALADSSAVVAPDDSTPVAGIDGAWEEFKESVHRVEDQYDQRLALEIEPLLGPRGAAIDEVSFIVPPTRMRARGRHDTRSSKTHEAGIDEELSEDPEAAPPCWSLVEELDRLESALETAQGVPPLAKETTALLVESPPRIEAPASDLDIEESCHWAAAQVTPSESTLCVPAVHSDTPPRAWSRQIQHPDEGLDDSPSRYRVTMDSPPSTLSPSPRQPLCSFLPRAGTPRSSRESSTRTPPERFRVAEVQTPASFDETAPFWQERSRQSASSRRSRRRKTAADEESLRTANSSISSRSIRYKRNSFDDDDDDALVLPPEAQGAIRQLRETRDLVHEITMETTVAAMRAELLATRLESYALHVASKKKRRSAARQASRTSSSSSRSGRHRSMSA